jgi:hypothetical protein
MCAYKSVNKFSTLENKAFILIVIQQPTIFFESTKWDAEINLKTTFFTPNSWTEYYCFTLVGAHHQVAEVGP